MSIAAVWSPEALGLPVPLAIAATILILVVMFGAGSLLLEYGPPPLEVWQEAQRKAQEEQRRQREAETRQLEEAARESARQREHEQELARHAAEMQARLRTLADTYGPFPLYQDPTWLEQYVQRHCAELLNRRMEIMDGAKAFHEDTVFIDLLRTEAPHLYERALWERYALARAEVLDIQQPAAPPAPPPEPQRKPPTPDEYRERGLRRKEVAMHDFLANLEFDFEALKQLRAKQQELGIDDDDFDRLVKRLNIMMNAATERKERSNDSETY